MSLIILAKSGEGRQKEELEGKKEGREPWADAVKWAAEAKWIFGSAGGGRSVRSRNVGNLYDWEGELTSK